MRSTFATKGTGKTVLDAVKTSVNPKVIDCPNPASGKTTIDAVAKDGIAVKVKARVTVRTNLERFVGWGDGGDDYRAGGRGHRDHHRFVQQLQGDVLENPDRISKTVLDKALDANTAFEILSIDIADVDVGDNVGAKLQAEQADANKLIAQAHAEIRAAAVAIEQEMTARTQEMRARVVEAEAQVPLAIAEAFRSGNLGESWITSESRTSRPTPGCATASRKAHPRIRVRNRSRSD